MTEGFVMLFDTAIGRCGIAWGDAGILAVSFPEENDTATLQRLHRRVPEAEQTWEAPEAVAPAIAGIRALAEGEAVGFEDARLDMAGVGEFEQGVYGLTRAIRPGETRTYGEIARTLGDISLSRRVGQALGPNLFDLMGG